MAVSCLILGLFTPNLGILWSLVCTFWICGSIVANRIIYRLIPSPFWLEIRQCQSITTSTVTSTKTLGWKCWNHSLSVAFFVFFFSFGYWHRINTNSLHMFWDEIVHCLASFLIKYPVGNSIFQLHVSCTNSSPVFFGHYILSIRG